MNRLDVREQVLLCEKCELHAKGNGPVPFSGPTPAHVAVIGEAPGRQEDRKGEPFIGPSGQLLRQHMVSVGLDPAQVAFMNAVSCWPDATPSGEHVHSCGTNLAAQLELADPRWVLLVGGVALSTLRPDLKVSRARGHVLYPPGRPRFMVTLHPSAALRNRQAEFLFHDDLALLVDMIDAVGEEWLRLGSDACVVCGIEVEDLVDHDGHLHFDYMGAVFCDACWERFNRPQPKVVPKLGVEQQLFS